MKSKNLIFISIIWIFSATDIFSQMLYNPTEEKKEDTLALKPGSGFQIANTKKGNLMFSALGYVRYLNSTGLDDTYTNTFGNTSRIEKRNDLQFQKIILHFRGWLLNPKFRYHAFVWTTNTNQGLGAQVVLGGDIQYKFNNYFDFGAGIGALPSNRSLLGQWPLWLRQDARPMAEEFFRASYTSGFWMQGEIFKGLYYKTMLGNNLSQLGVDAAQLDDGFNTWATSLWWTSDSKNRFGSYGDFEKHTTPAYLTGASYTRSGESRQSQPEANDPENSQIRLSDGSNIFGFNTFGPNSQVTKADYHMFTFFGGIKYRGFSIDGDYYLRWINNFKYDGKVSTTSLFDHGFSIQLSGMIGNKIQLYGVGSTILGEYGNPFELNFGLNWYPFKNRIFRLNSEFIYTEHSPVGYLSYPTVVGATGEVFMINLELFL